MRVSRTGLVWVALTVTILVLVAVAVFVVQGRRDRAAGVAKDAAVGRAIQQLRSGLRMWDDQGYPSPELVTKSGLCSPSLDWFLRMRGWPSNPFTGKTMRPGTGQGTMNTRPWRGGGAEARTTVPLAIDFWATVVAARLWLLRAKNGTPPSISRSTTSGRRSRPGLSPTMDHAQRRPSSIQSALPATSKASGLAAIGRPIPTRVSPCTPVTLSVTTSTRSRLTAEALSLEDGAAPGGTRTTTAGRCRPSPSQRLHTTLARRDATVAHSLPRRRSPVARVWVQNFTQA
jgi:hypothetical protein